MTLTEQIIKDMTTAMKNQDKFSLSVLRMLKSALQLEKINKKHDLSDEEVIAVIKKQVKMRKDSIEEYTKFNKTEEVDSLNKEIECLATYLPEELSHEQIEKGIEEIFNELKPESIKDMGKVMKAAQEKFQASADMTVVSNIVREKLK